MRKALALGIALAILAVGVVAVLPAAAAEPQPDCYDQNGNPLPAGIYHQWVKTEPDGQLQNSELWGGAVLCGSEPDIYRGYTGGKIETPELKTGGQDIYGMEMRCANPDYDVPGNDVCQNSDGRSDLGTGRFVGESSADLLLYVEENGHYSYNGEPTEDLAVKFYVKQAPGGPANPACTASYQGNPVVQCMQGVTAYGPYSIYSPMIVTKYQSGAGQGGSTGRYRVHIFQPEATMPDGTHLVGLVTKIGKRGIWDPAEREYVPDPADPQQEMHICRWAGPVGASQCGSGPENWVMKNGRFGLYRQCGPWDGTWPRMHYGWVITAYKNWGSPPNPQKCAWEQWYQ